MKAKDSNPIDALIIVALPEELLALQAVSTGLRQPWTKIDGDPPFHTTVFEGQGGLIRVAAARLTRMAGVAAAAAASQLSTKLQPGCITMCGVCAGHPDHTDLGDVVIGDRLFQYDEGKNRGDGFHGDLWMNVLRDDWLRVAQDHAGAAVDFHGYCEPDEASSKWWFLERILAGYDPLRSVALRRYIPDSIRADRLKALENEQLITFSKETFRLTRKGKREISRQQAFNGTLVSSIPFHVHVGPIGSGNSVEASGTIWQRLTEGNMRKVLAAEMEAAAIGRVAHEHKIPFIIAKGVMDHADLQKSDRFKSFAARASAEVLCTLLRAVVKSSIPSSEQLPAVSTPASQPPKSIPHQSFRPSERRPRLDKPAAVHFTDGISSLITFLADAFKRHELEIFVRKFPDGNRLVLEIPTPPATPLQIADGIVDLFHRHRLLDRDFFIRLSQERPHRSAEINLIMQSYYPGPSPIQLLCEGTLLCGGHYQLNSRVSTGGFGTLWKAHDTKSGSIVAVKVLSREIDDKDYAWRRAMFIKGAARVANIQHNNVAKVITAHQYDQGYDFCILEYIEGATLYDMVRNEHSRFSIINLILMALELGRGLEGIHATSSAHGDVSPKNIVLRNLLPPFHPCLVDFDLVCATGYDETTKIATGMPGTDPYSAPEWRTRRGHIDQRVDVFGLGMTMIHVLHGTTPPASLNEPGAMQPCVFIREKLISKCPAPLQDVLVKACDHIPNNRYQSVSEFCAALTEAKNQIETPQHTLHERNDKVTDEDHHLLICWVAGDRAAGDRLIERNFNALRRFICLQLGDTEDAADLVQDTFQTLLEKHRDIRSFRPFMFAVARDKIRHYFALRAGQSPSVSITVSVNGDSSAVSRNISGLQYDSPAEQLSDRRSQQKWLLKALRELPVEHVMALELYIWEEMTAAQVAEVLGKTEGTVRHLLRDAKRMVKENLATSTRTSEAVDTSELVAWFDDVQARARGLEGSE